MIKNVAQLLGALLDQEKKKLDEYSLKHAPTIGKMYEGLTADILERAIPKELGLQIVHGVICDDSDIMTGEIDCMLVKGKGEQIPYTDSYKWHIKNVISVFEVKKTLYSKDLADAFIHVRDVLESHSRYIQGNNSNDTFNISAARKAFAETTKKIAPPHRDVHKLPFNEQMIFHTLVTEQLSPIRIILGHHGFKSEYTFRKAMTDFLNDNLNTYGFGVRSFPQLIISERYSLVKANGQPYSAPMRNEYWDFYGSSQENPLIFILEMIWTRLQRDFKIGGLWGEDLHQECLHLFLSGRAIKDDKKLGWEYQITSIAKKTLEEDIKADEWSPVYLNKPQFTILNTLCGGASEKIDDPDLIAYVEKYDLTIDEFIVSLLETGLIALEGNELKLITDMCQCVILPTGEYIAAENNSGRLNRWLEKQTINKENA